MNVAMEKGKIIIASWTKLRFQEVLDLGDA